MEPGPDHCPGAIRAGSGADGLMTVPGRGWGGEGDRTKSIPYKRAKKKPGAVGRAFQFGGEF
jgi:hypothetical protein